MQLGLQGRKVLVAGATRGIGLAIAEVFLEEGSSVSICGRTADSLEAARQHLQAVGGDGRVFARRTDLTDAIDTKALVEETVEALGGLDVYVHCASGFSGPGEEGWMRTLTTDVLAPVRVVDAALDALEASDAGSIVFIGSTASVQWFARPGARPSGYGPAKAAQRVLANEMAQTLGRQGIRANVISPGATFFEGGSWDRVRVSEPELWNGLVRQFPFRRLVTAREVAQVVAFVASPAGAGINATHIVVDGGQTKSVQ
ncbi:MAG: SDR family NAD(P)-dependent oxidoreductase [Acidimicrobiales bacterium]